jgi:hypothetical protein
VRASPTFMAIRTSILSAILIHRPSGIIPQRAVFCCSSCAQAFNAKARPGRRKRFRKDWHGTRLFEAGQPVKTKTGQAANCGVNAPAYSLRRSALPLRISVPSASNQRFPTGRGSQAGKSHDFRYPGRGVGAPVYSQSRAPRTIDKPPAPMSICAHRRHLRCLPSSGTPKDFWPQNNAKL